MPGRHRKPLLPVKLLVIVIVAVAALCDGVMAAPAARTALPARADFDVSIDGGPESIAKVPADIRPSLSNCSPSGRVPPLTVTCTFPYTWRSQDPLTGTISWPATGRNGTFRLLCDWQVDTQIRAVLNVDASFRAAGLTIAFSGSGTQPCSWTAAFGASTLTGTLQGHVAIGLSGADTSPPATLGSFDGTFDVRVVAGTGEFAGASGSGSFTEHETFDFAAKLPSLDSITALLAALPRPQPAPATPASTSGGAAAPGAPAAGAAGADTTAKVQAAISACQAAGLQMGTAALDACASAAAGVPVKTSATARAEIRHEAGAGGTSSTLTLRLAPGVALPVVVAPASVTRAGSYRLHVAATPGATCSGAAVAGARTVALGSAVDADRDGAVIFSSPLAAKLGVGQWALTVSCAPSGGPAARATAKLLVSG